MKAFLTLLGCCFLGLLVGILGAAFLSLLFYLGFCIESMQLASVTCFWKIFGFLFAPFSIAGFWGGLTFGWHK